MHDISVAVRQGEVVRQIALDALGLAGLGLLVAGVYRLSVPAAMIFGGASLIAIAAVIAFFSQRSA